MHKNLNETRSSQGWPQKSYSIPTIPYAAPLGNALVISNHSMHTLHSVSLTSPPVFLVGFNTHLTLQRFSNGSITVSSHRHNSPSDSSARLTAVNHGNGHLDKAMYYLLDNDSTPDKCTDPILLLVCSILAMNLLPRNCLTDALT